MHGHLTVTREGERSERPESASQLAELLAIAANEGNPLRIVGGNGARLLGNPHRSTGWTLSTAGINRVIEYEPTDMTVSVEAGASLAEISAILGQHRQMLPIEAPTPAKATIGGLLATGLSGPRRYGGGTLRDVLIGISVAYPDGTVGKAGGMVVKNVSGFDMMRIHYGAMGTLGVIISANFKVLPLPRAEFTALASYAELGTATQAAMRLRPLAARPIALVVRQFESGWQLAARYEGRDSGLKTIRSSLADQLRAHSQTLDSTESSSFWSEFMNGRAMDCSTEVRLGISVAPGSIFTTVDKILALVGQEFRLVRFEVEPGVGLVTASVEQLSSQYPHSLQALVHGLRAQLSGSVVTVLAAPDVAKAGLDVWGDEPDTLDIMRMLKQEFDPRGILNLGCFVGHI